MRRPRALRAAVTAGIALAVVVPGIAGASTGPAPGSPAYLARDTQNIADAYGRQTAPAAARPPPTGAGQRAAHRRRPTRRSCWQQAATPDASGARRRATLVPGLERGQPATRRAGTARAAASRRCRSPNRYGALIRGDVFAPLPGAHDPYTGAPLHGPFPGVVITTGSVQG